MNKSLAAAMLLTMLVPIDSFGADPASTPILPPTLPWSGDSEKLIVDGDHPWVTPVELSGFDTTPSYAETTVWLQRLVDATPQLRMQSLGRSAEGRDIWMVIASANEADSSSDLQANGKPTLLAQAGIHSGEIDGKDAGMMMLRDLRKGERLHALLDKVNLLFVPILSVDGHERSSAFSRVNQRGPAQMGWRTNRRNLNLNRDYAKLETEELRHLVQAINEWQPDLYLDLHVTDGADYQYDITYGFNQGHAWSPRIGAWLETVFSPAIDQALSQNGHIPGPLVFAANDADMSGGNLVWTAGPRFSNGWGDARHLPTVLVENHSLKPYRQRVLGTYVIVEASMRLLAQQHAALSTAIHGDRSSPSASVALGWRTGVLDPDDRAEFKAIRSEKYQSAVAGAEVVRWTGEPELAQVLQVRMNQPTVRVDRPRAYYIPAAWYPIVDKLRQHGIEVERLEEGRRIAVDRYRLVDAALNANASPFEGRTLFLPGTPQVEHLVSEIPAGSYRVDAYQPLGTLAMLLLEPESPDSLFQWGYFAEIMQRTEYIEAYVMEPMAQAMLADDPELRAEFKRKLEQDEAFAANPSERLQWFYRKTPFFDPAYREYPILRGGE